ncbi:MAG: sodium/glutamate symporter [Moraxellaceae bacterium]|nr:sodium/glutamate symporter [Moraxellaceae bacterium]MDZ4386286.1 sodium/glutamate symporter [Moraxellaceae bacterium]
MALLMDDDAILVGTPAALSLAIVALWLGYHINKRVPFLHHYNIPAAVTGGLPISLIVALIEAAGLAQLRFNLELRDMLLIVFFSTIGLSAKFAQMLEGGKALTIMLVLAVVFLAAQNLLGTGLANMLGEDPLYGLIGGSISLAGGHGTALTWGQMFEEHFELANASSLGLTFATAGLITGGLIGGPVAAYLIKRHQLQPPSENLELLSVTASTSRTYVLHAESMLRATFMIAICFGLGALVYDWIADRGIRVPAFLTAMFLGIVITNGMDLFKINFDKNPVQFIGDISLQLFLGMSLISLPLLSLQGAMGGIMLVMMMQALLISAFTVFIVFPLLGRDYDAACISAGFIGMGVGATPVGIANMNAITSRFGPSPKAYLVIPLLGAFFIDIANALLVQLILGFY